MLACAGQRTPLPGDEPLKRSLSSAAPCECKLIEKKNHNCHILVQKQLPANTPHYRYIIKQLMHQSNLIYVIYAIHEQVFNILSILL